MDDHALLLRLKVGDETAFDAIFRLWYLALVRHAGQRLGRRHAIAEEVVQDVMLELWRHRASLDPAGSVRAYLFTAVRNRTRNVARHERVTTRAMPLFTAEETDRRARREPADAAARETELESAVRRAIDTLPPRCREVFLLNREQGLRYADIAQRLGVSVKAVEGHMGRALRIMRAELAAWLPGTDLAARR